MSLSIGYSVGGAFSIGVPGSADSAGGLTLVVDKGALTIAGKAVLRDTTKLVQRAGLVVSGKSFGLVNSSLWQYISVTSVGLIGLVETLFDGLLGVTPAVGDMWRVPKFSRDGGSVVVFGDGQFEISQPTSGRDFLDAVMYYDASAGVWYGPADFTILGPLLTLVVNKTTIYFHGDQVDRQLDTTRVVTPAHLNLIGRSIYNQRAYTVDAAHLVLTGGLTDKQRNLFVTPAHLTVTGATIVANLSQLTLPVLPGHITFTGGVVQNDRAYTVDNASLDIVGKDVVIGEGFPFIDYPADAGHLTIIGALITLEREPLVIAGHLVFRGRDITLKVTRRILLDGVFNRVIKLDGVATP